MMGTVTVATGSAETDLLSGLWYINLHTSTFGGGEIRGQISFAVLPVELISFAAKSKNIMMYPDWKTATEPNNDYFQIAYSQDGRIGTVKGQGTSQAAKNYTYTHQRPVKGLSHYRLRQVDFDGACTYSAVVSVEIEMKEIRIFPNPTTGGVEIRSPATAGTVRVTNHMGQLVRQQDLSQQQFIDLSSQPKGFYFVELRVENEITVTRVVKE